MPVQTADTAVEREVERRLKALRDDPEKLLAYDRNGDGVIDANEWELVRRAITAEVRTSRERHGGAFGAEPAPEIVHEHYEVLEDIGRGGQARTYKARDRRDGQTIVLKELDLEFATDWKAIELFEREGKVLGSLHHPGIPGYIDAFRVEAQANGGIRFFLAQEYVPGGSLQDAIDAGERFDEKRARAFLLEAFDILEYLHSKSPPVIHRDIKPSNILVRPDDTLALVDFGAVQQIIHGSVGGETVVGTSGFLPPEQLMGRACPASDLYALAATVVYAMSGEHPSDLPIVGMRLQYQHKLRLSAPFEVFIDKMLAPFVEDRFETVDQARDALQTMGSSRTRAMVPHRSTVPAKPVTKRFEKGRVTLARSPQQLTVRVEPARSKMMAILAVSSVIAYAAMLYLWFDWMNLPVMLEAALIPVIFVLIAVGSWFGGESLRIDARSFSIERRFFGMKSRATGRTRELYGMSVLEGTDTRWGTGAQSSLMLSQGNKDHHFGNSLKDATRTRICRDVNDFLEELPS